MVLPEVQLQKARAILQTVGESACSSISDFVVIEIELGKALALLQTKTALVLVLVQVQVLVLVLFCVLVLVLVLVLGWFCCWLLGWFCCWLLVRLLFTPLRASERPLNIL